MTASGLPWPLTAVFVRLGTLSDARAQRADPIVQRLPQRATGHGNKLAT